MTAWDLRQRYQHLPSGKKVCFKDLAIGELTLLLFIWQS
jgi:hypothetical protein